MFKIRSIGSLSKENFQRYMELKNNIHENLVKTYHFDNDVVLNSAENMAIIEISMEIQRQLDKEDRERGFYHG